MVRLSFWAFFNLHPALFLPFPDLGFIPLEGPTHGPLATPAQLPQDAPSLGRVVAHSTFFFDQVRHSPGGPQTGFVAQCFGAALQSAFDASQVCGTQAWLAPSAPGLLQGLLSARGQLLGPATHRLPMHTHLPGHFRLRNALPQQPCGEPAPLFQFLEVPPNTFWVSHALNIAQESSDVTILFNIQ